MDVTIEQTNQLLPSGCSVLAFSPDGARVGHAHLSVDADIVTLADIIIYSYSVPYVFWLPFIKRRINYRNKGIGSKLLKKVIEICEASEISVLKGEMHGDIEKLKLWYAKNGFTINGKCINLMF